MMADVLPLRIPSLNGLRALSVTLVLFAHAAGTRGLPLDVQARFGDLGNLGVRIFFVISGFLITHLLIAESEATGRISLGQFYLRRMFRIMPAFLVFVLAVTALAAAGVIRLEHGDVWHALTFTVNFHPVRAWQVGHLWSLSVEEQFYALWPLAIVLWGATGASRVAAAAIVVAPVSRVVLYLAFPHLRSGIGETFPTVMDAIACGCLLSLIRTRLHQHQPYRRFLHSPAAMLVLLPIAGCNLLLPRISFSYTIGETVLNVAIAILIDRVISVSDDWVGMVLNWRPIDYVGTISYSLYLWQQLFVNRHADAAAAAFPANLVLTIVAAIACHVLVERPFLRMRPQRRHVASPQPRRFDADVLTAAARV